MDVQYSMYHARIASTSVWYLQVFVLRRRGPGGEIIVIIRISGIQLESVTERSAFQETCPLILRNFHEKSGKVLCSKQARSCFFQYIYRRISFLSDLSRPSSR